MSIFNLFKSKNISAYALFTSLLQDNDNGYSTAYFFNHLLGYLDIKINAISDEIKKIADNINDEKIKIKQSKKYLKNLNNLKNYKALERKKLLLLQKKLSAIADFGRELNKEDIFNQLKNAKLYFTQIEIKQILQLQSIEINMCSNARFIPDIISHNNYFAKMKSIINDKTSYRPYFLKDLLAKVKNLLLKIFTLKKNKKHMNFKMNNINMEVVIKDKKINDDIIVVLTLEDISVFQGIIKYISNFEKEELAEKVKDINFNANFQNITKNFLKINTKKTHKKTLEVSLNKEQLIILKQLAKMHFYTELESKFDLSYSQQSSVATVSSSSKVRHS